MSRFIDRYEGQATRELRGGIRGATEPILASYEQLILCSQGGYKDNMRSIWKLGRFYLTNQRLLFFVPSRTIFETPLSNIREIRVEKQRYVAGRVKDVIAIGYQSPITRRPSRAWIIMNDLEDWRKELLERAQLTFDEESLNKVMEELDPVGREIVAYLWGNCHATIGELADLVSAPSHMHVLLKIRDDINPLAESVSGNPLLVFERSRIDPDTGEKVLFSWWMVAPEEARQREKKALLDVFDEGDHLEVIVELMGVATEDVSISVTEDRLTISANRQAKSYYEEVALPAKVNPNRYIRSYSNGVLVVRLEKLSQI